LLNAAGLDASNYGLTITVTNGAATGDVRRYLRALAATIPGRPAQPGCSGDKGCRQPIFDPEDSFKTHAA